jgi:Putative Actinobacterial Holin-X, holin superfamily III
MPTHTSESGDKGAAAKRVAEHASALARLEVELAQLEVKRKAASLGSGAALAVGAGIVALFAFGFGMATLAAALAVVLDTWLALLIVFALLVLLAAVLGLVGRAQIRKGSPPVPEQAIEEARLTTEVLKGNGG